MALLEEILKWTENKLTLWQRDAARRLFEQDDQLSEDDYVQLYALLKEAYGLPSPGNVTSIPLDSTHLPAVLKPGQTVVLKTMRNLKHVNRIASKQPLKFLPTGVTVIYGGNGSGKSGYGRVMKQACRARDQVDNVHPDATDAASQDLIPEATFDIEVGGATKSVTWKSGNLSPDELSTIAVFDSRCARVFLTAEQTIAYMPNGLAVVENLAHEVLPGLSRRLEEEIEGVNVDHQPFAHLSGDTEVGRLLGDLSKKSDPATVKLLAKLSEQETRHISELEQALSEADPKAKAEEFRLSAGRLKELANRIEAALTWVSPEAVARLNSLNDARQAAAKAEQLAAEAFRSDEDLLPGNGEPAWKLLFKAARTFSTEAAYSGHEFPHTETGAVCPLCQQTLRDGAERLERFETYIQKDAAKSATLKRQLVQNAKVSIERATVSLGLDASLTAELAILDETVGETTRAFESAIKVRQTSMLDAIETHSWNDVAALSENPRQRLRDLAARQFKSARAFERASDEQKKAKLQTELDELRARQLLSKCVEAVLELVERMKFKHKLESCRKDLKTRPISDKSKEFASNAVTTALKSALNSEFKTLGIGHIRTRLKERIHKGKMKYQLVLDLPTTNKLEEILSEGEQRAIAIGSFLAELRLANHLGGIVFDDPVSSLDHWSRQRVAKRLVDEAVRRQVIVLTHDTVFLRQLMDAIDVSGIPSSMLCLEWQGNHSGNVIEGLPWEHQKCKERIKFHEQAQKDFAAIPWPAYPGKTECEAMRHEYSRLRATIERVVEEFVLNGVVERFSDWIQVGRLKEVVGFNTTEHSELSRLHKRCHRVVDAHDPASNMISPVPTATELEADLAALNKLIADIKRRRKPAKTTATSGK